MSYLHLVWLTGVFEKKTTTEKDHKLRMILGYGTVMPSGALPEIMNVYGEWMMSQVKKERKKGFAFTIEGHAMWVCVPTVRIE